MHGVAYTVFEGVKPEPMDVEVLGVLRNANGPKGDIILVRLHGKKVEYTGVVAGMSGSPVYVDGKLMGAIAFRIGEFSKEPIAGVTPIDEDAGDQRARQDVRRRTRSRFRPPPKARPRAPAAPARSDTDAGRRQPAAADRDAAGLQRLHPRCGQPLRAAVRRRRHRARDGRRFGVG